MKKIEAATLADAYEQAARELSCSITELQYEVIQHPSSGVLGMFKKNAIIVAECKREERSPEPQINAQLNSQLNSIEKIVAEEIIEEVLISDKSQAYTSEHIKVKQKAKREEVTQKTPKKEMPQRVKNELNADLTQQDDVVLDSFFETKSTAEEAETPEATTKQEERDRTEELRPSNNNLQLAQEIEGQLKELISYSCFDIDTIEVDVVDGTALIFMDGDDAALLIGKEGYRYNALSYMIFNWLHTKYDLYIKLEIAEFITTQQEMIKNHIKPVIEYVQINGRGKTRPLDGILVQIALEQLREAFPNKYVAIKTGKDGRKFVIINEFNNKNHTKQL